MTTPRLKLTPPRFCCFVPGKPTTQGNHRINRAGTHIYDSNRNLGPWRKAMASAFWREVARLYEAHQWLADAERAPDVAKAWGRPVVLFYGPVTVLCEFVLPRLASHPKTERGKPVGLPTGKMDICKLERALNDSLKDGHVVADDGQICHVVKSKRYAAIGEEPGIHVQVEAMP